MAAKRNHSAMNGNKDDAFSRALAGNAKWCDDTAKADSTFFEKNAAGQAPKIFWIGCCDSRVPETTILGLKPGDVFTHRNIANILVPNDISSLAAIEFAVVHVKVEHVVVCGHTSCGGVMGTVANKSLGIMDPWLFVLRELRMKHAEELEKLKDVETKEKRLTELNVKHSLEVLKMNPSVIEAVHTRGLKIHGALFNLATGKLEMVEDDEDEKISKRRLVAFRQDNEAPKEPVAGH